MEHDLLVDEVPLVNIAIVHGYVRILLGYAQPVSWYVFSNKHGACEAVFSRREEWLPQVFATFFPLRNLLQDSFEWVY